MRFSTISAVLYGLAIGPGVVSQATNDGFNEGGGTGAGANTSALARTQTRMQTLSPAPTMGADPAGSDGGQSSSSPSPTGILGDLQSDNGSTGSQIASGSKVSQIAGGVVGGVLGLALIGGLIFFLKRRKRNREKPSAHHESAVIADKSRASSPISHTSPIYGGAGAAVVPEPAAPARQFTNPEFANPPPSQQPVVPIAPVHTPQQQAVHSPGSPAELQSREVDEDGVSVNSFDMQRPVDEPTVPRLPVCRPKGSGL